MEYTRQSTLFINSHFYHGTSGLAQCYKALYYETSKWRYKNAYDYWINVTLSSIDKELEENIYSANSISLLEESTGVAQVLTDYLSDSTFNWSMVLLL